jgi:hypothetical protein
VKRKKKRRRKRNKTTNKNYTGIQSSNNTKVHFEKVFGYKEENSNFMNPPWDFFKLYLTKDTVVYTVVIHSYERIEIMPFLLLIFLKLIHNTF